MKSKALFFALLVLIIFHSEVRGQQYVDRFPRSLLPFENAVCRVSVEDSGGSSSHGSGVLFSAQGRKLVLTAQHVLRDRKPGARITATWDDTLVPLKLLAERPDADCAILLPVNPPADIPAACLLERDVRQGDTLFAFGFGSTSSNRLRCTGGKFFKYTTNMSRQPYWFDMWGFTRDGDSGGPVFLVENDIPYLVGNLWGCAREGRGWTVAAVRPNVVWSMLNIDFPGKMDESTGTKPKLVPGGS